MSQQLSPRDCGKCGERPRRAAGQRWCKECHAEYVLDRRLQKSVDAETDAADLGPLSGVYFFECDGFIKIGVSSNVCARHRQIKSSNPREVKPLGFQAERGMKAADALEDALHARFVTQRYRAEWFHDCPEIRAYIDQHAQAWPTQDDVQEGEVKHLSPDDCAKVLNVSGEFIRGEIKDGRLSARRLERSSGRVVYRIDPDDFTTYTEKHWPKVTPERQTSPA